MVWGRKELSGGGMYGSGRKIGFGRGRRFCEGVDGDGVGRLRGGGVDDGLEMEGCGGEGGRL